MVQIRFPDPCEHDTYVIESRRLIARSRALLRLPVYPWLPSCPDILGPSQSSADVMVVEDARSSLTEAA
jgi:hypothetical protein